MLLLSSPHSSPLRPFVITEERSPAARNMKPPVGTPQSKDQGSIMPGTLNKCGNKTLAPSSPGRSGVPNPEIDIVTIQVPVPRRTEKDTAVQNQPKLLEVKSQNETDHRVNNTNICVPNTDRDTDQYDMMTTETLFQKKRTLKSPEDDFPIPHFPEFFSQRCWKMNELEELKLRLNHTKTQIDHLPLDQWHKHTKKMILSGNVVPAVRKMCRAEFGSQAWCKFFECLKSYPIVPSNVTKRLADGVNPVFCSVHLCEAPGAFISATNHFLRSHYPRINWKWLGTTLNPHYEGNDVGSMINDDKLILGSLDNWTFLQDGTGNIMNEQNINALIKEVQKKFESPVSLVTADGSIDCQSNPLEQEAMVAQLHFAEIVAALHILGDGGTFVLKIFTFFECQTLSHLRLLCSLFEEVHLFKPVTSKEGNSEVYVICLRFRGKSLILKELMVLKLSVDAQDKFNCSLLPRSRVLRDPFISRVKEAAKFFTEFQMEIMNRNLTVYFSVDPDVYYFTTDLIRAEVLQKWLDEFGPVLLLQKRDRLFGHIYSRRTTHLDTRSEVGTFSDKLCRKNAGVFKKMRFIEHEMEFFKTYGQSTLIRADVKGRRDQFIVAKAKPYENILSSRFCFGKLLSLRQELRINVQRFGSVLKSAELITHSQNNCSDPPVVIKELSEVFNPIKVASKSTDWKMLVVCFHQAPNELYFNTDFDITRMELTILVNEIRSLQKGHSLFLCQFPLLTRLHVGTIYMLSTIFEMTVVYLGIGKKLRGVILHGFLGITPKDSWLDDLTGILTNLTGKEKFVPLEIVPTKVLIEMGNFDEVFEYNLYNMGAGLEKIIPETRNQLIKAAITHPVEFKKIARTPDELDILSFR